MGKVLTTSQHVVVEDRGSYLLLDPSSFDDSLFAVEELSTGSTEEFIADLFHNAE